jgi:Right handed beta helix region
MTKLPRSLAIAAVAGLMLSIPSTPADAAPSPCPAYPAFPDAACTGPTTDNLPVYAGSEDFSDDGQLIENVEIHVNRGIQIDGDNVTFRNVKIVWDGALGEDIITNDGSNTTFENCMIDGRGSAERAVTGDGHGSTVRNCEIFGVGNAIEIEAPALVEENYIHDIRAAGGTDWHADGVQLPDGAANVTVRHNTIILTGEETGAIFIMGEADNRSENVLITQNLVAGGSYTMYTEGGPGYRVIDNHMSTQIFPKVGYYNIWYFDLPQGGEERRGNVIHETGASADHNI